jgi:hypothetical protein
MTQIKQNVISISSPTSEDQVTTKGYIDGYISNYVPIFGGIETITEVVLDSGGTTQTIWSKSIDGYSDICVISELKCSANDGGIGKRLNGPLVCTAKRYGLQSLSITSQSSAIPWVCDEPNWLPQFDVNGNNLILQLTPDTVADIQVRGRVNFEIVNTYNDVEPSIHNEAWLFSSISSLLGSKVIEQFATPTGSTSITGITGSNGHVMSPGGTGSYTKGTIGTLNRAATTAPTAFAGYLRCADVGQAIKSVVSVCQIPTFPDATNYQVLFGTGGVSSATNKTMVQSSGTVLFTNDWSHYVNNILTNTLPATGSIAIIRADLSSNTDQSFQTGYATASFVWRGAVGYWLLLNDTLTVSEASSLQTLLSGFFV